ncbi:hypothetical protein D3C83_12130 [compost metagenome]
MNTTSFRSGAYTRKTRKRSASAVEEETWSRAASGPVISISCSSGRDRNVTPSPGAS